MDSAWFLTSLQKFPDLPCYNWINLVITTRRTVDKDIKREGTGIALRWNKIFRSSSKYSTGWQVFYVLETNNKIWPVKKQKTAQADIHCIDVDEFKYFIDYPYMRKSIQHY